RPDSLGTCCASCSLLVCCPSFHRDLHSFPTRRSSDLRFSAGTLKSAIGQISRTRQASATGQLRRKQEQRPPGRRVRSDGDIGRGDRKSTRLNSSHVSISYAVCCLKKKKRTTGHRIK